MRLLFTGSVASWLVLFCGGVLPGGCTKSPPPQAPLVDEDYRFRLIPPDRGWKLLDENEARRVTPDAVAGAVDIMNQRYGMVIVEPVLGTSLADYAQLLADAMPLEGREVGRLEKVDLQGREAIRFVVSGTVRGLAVRYLILTFFHQQHAYQLVAWGMAARVPADGSTLEPFLKAFSLSEGPVRSRRLDTRVPDARGVGWRVKDGVYESAVHRLRVEPRGDWKLLVGQELQLTNPDAEVGLKSAHAYVIFIVEVFDGPDPAAFAGMLIEKTAKALEAEGTGEKITVKVDGRDVVLTSMRAGAFPNAVSLFGVHFEGDRAIQILAWYHDAVGDRSGAILSDAFGSVRFLGEQAHGRLLADLAAQPDPQNQVGATFSVRRGTYRDFKNRLLWRKPKGLWRIKAGQDARLINPEADLYIEEPAAGLFGLLIAEPSAGMKGRHYHELVAGNMFPGGKRAPPRPSRFGEVPAFTSAGRDLQSGIRLDYLLATAVHQDLAVQFSFWGGARAMKQNADKIQAAVDGLRLGQALSPVRQSTDEYRDNRFGFVFRTPGPGWSMLDTTPGGFTSVGTFVRFAGQGRAVNLLAICALQPGHDVDWFMEFLMGFIREKFGELAGSEPAKSQARLAGATWDRISWPGPQTLEVYLTVRDKTFYALLVTAGRRIVDSATLIQGFEFLD